MEGLPNLAKIKKKFLIGLYIIWDKKVCVFKKVKVPKNS